MTFKHGFFMDIHTYTIFFHHDILLPIEFLLYFEQVLVMIKPFAWGNLFRQLFGNDISHNQTKINRKFKSFEIQSRIQTRDAELWPKQGSSIVVLVRNCRGHKLLFQLAMRSLDWGGCFWFPTSETWWHFLCSLWWSRIHWACVWKRCFGSNIWQTYKVSK